MSCYGKNFKCGQCEADDLAIQRSVMKFKGLPDATGTSTTNITYQRTGEDGVAPSVAAPIDASALAKEVPMIIIKWTNGVNTGANAGSQGQLLITLPTNCYPRLTWWKDTPYDTDNNYESLTVWKNATNADGTVVWELRRSNCWTGSPFHAQNSAVVYVMLEPIFIKSFVV